MTLDRTQSPAFQAIHEIQLPSVQSHRLDNGIPLHLISVAQQPVLRLECVFDAGTWYEQVPSSAFFAMKMLSEGTASRSSAQINEYVDRYGAFMELNSGPDRASIVIHCLTKFLPNVLPLLSDILNEPTFPQKELDDLRNIILQNLRVNYEKNAYLAGVLFREKLFGTYHPYGRSQRPEAVEEITREGIIAFYERAIRNRQFQVILAGHATENEVLLINRTLGQLPVRTDILPDFSGDVPADIHSPILAEKPDSIQSSIRLGRRLFTRAHPDFFRMLVTNEILGGYFGSRLMKNIREEKGFTYGISSNMPSFRRDGYFLIGTDVNKENTQETLNEIRKEIHILQTEPVSASELETVKNYMAGEFVGSLNTPFEIADRYKVILLDGMPADFLATYIQKLRAVTPADIMETAIQYLAVDSLGEVVVGGK
ncbi:insulinase family protein [Spirosoma sp. KCTC 42546]|uniref:M16 family metallopeptidase n=1 Tax=Spirosoma sp. KCTC 42546 TaxID=2520506 RepID=UPI00115A0633|nr:pitrilysin family protein [Spirosoma sp. KCTC 42546]QDK82914.1 insulinase family protein [Spirosoma sp. KCTC 42546]